MDGLPQQSRSGTLTVNATPAGDDSAAHVSNGLVSVLGMDAAAHGVAGATVMAAGEPGMWSPSTVRATCSRTMCCDCCS